MVLAHRLAYETLIGPVPDGLQIDHLCRVRLCCNPAHLEAVTAKTNTRRAPTCVATINANKTACLRGHPYDEKNTHRKGPKRWCRKCDADRKRLGVRRSELPIPT